MLYGLGTLFYNVFMLKCITIYLLTLPVIGFDMLFA